MSTTHTSPDRDFDRVERAIRYVADNRLDQPELADVADAVGLSEFHLQRLFTRWAGVGPKKFLQFLTLDHAKESLDQSASVMDAAFDAGLSGPGRLHDLFVGLEAVTPGEYKSRGAGLTFRFGFHPSPLGESLVVVSDRGLTGLAFVMDGDRQGALDYQMRGWEEAAWVPDDAATAELAGRAFATLRGDAGATSSLPLHVRGTAFQIKVWEALLRIPEGHTTTYGRLAEAMGRDKGSSRAVGTACGANLIGILIPCHRVIRDTGALSGYRWGLPRKHALLGLEALRTEASSASAA